MTPVDGQRYDMSDPEQRTTGITAAVVAVRSGESIVLPTDTVYGIGADAFSASAVAGLLAAKGRGREMPPPVLVANSGTLAALAIKVPDWAHALVDTYWPGGLTIVCHQQPSLRWDLGETRGTVAVRVPDHPVAIELLERTGPLAVSSANRSGMPAATGADAAIGMLGDAVSVVLDGGPVGAAGAEPSTIVAATGERPRLLRAGAIPTEELRTFLAGQGVELDTGRDEGGPADSA
jgi:tRNA threonylcarbamoyl adenosine modification protein (Sua5/YciO/YrdC/YwlC family)